MELVNPIIAWKRRKPYPQVKVGEWVTPKRKFYKAACCDCGLVHRVELRLVTTPNGGKQIQWRMFRDNRATAAVRREMKKHK